MTHTPHLPYSAAEALGFSLGSKNPAAAKAQGAEISRYPLPFLSIPEIEVARDSPDRRRILQQLDLPARDLVGCTLLASSQPRVSPYCLS
jgi:hypothetical protein